MASFTTDTSMQILVQTNKITIYTVGGLVAGKVLAKAGIFALIAKFDKVIIANIIAAFHAIRSQ